MSKIIKSKSKYVCKDSEKLKEFLLKEGFIFKSSNVRADEYYIDQDMEMLENDSCIRIRTINNKDIELLFDGNVRGVSLEVKDKQLVHMDVSQRDFIAKFMTDLGYYKYVSMSILRETYIKKDKEHYYSINIDTIADIGEFIDYDIYTDANSTETEKKFDEFESKISECIGESIDKEYRDYISKLMYNKFLKGEFLNRILVELEKIFVYIDLNNIEESIKENTTLINLELIEQLEQKGIQVEIVYSNLSDEKIEKIKNVLDKMGYNPSFINIKDIKELAVKETYILEKQKKIEFSEAAFIVLSQRI
ncbi:MAG: hypothetical protein IKD74_05575 [Clostridia bacterium]|nr:hypothetical protein [Clostridia bacterium]